MPLSCTISAPWTLSPKKHAPQLQTQGLSVGADCKPQRTCLTDEIGTPLSFTSDHHQFDFTLINYAAVAAPLPVLGEDKPLLTGPELQPPKQGWRSSLGQYLCQSVKPHLKAEPTGCVHVSRHQLTQIMIFKARSFFIRTLFLKDKPHFLVNLTAVLVPPGMCVSRRTERQFIPPNMPQALSEVLQEREIHWWDMKEGELGWE